MIRPSRDAFPSKGPGRALRRFRCWWRGEHDWDKPLKRPYPWRSLTCTCCGARWKYLHPRGLVPPMLGQVNRECPRCYMLTSQPPKRTRCRCQHCGQQFRIEDRQLRKCDYCGNSAKEGQSCAGCGAS